MDIIRKILPYIVNQCTAFFVIAAVIVFLHCFYDSGFRWNRKKVLFMLAYLLVDAVLMFFLGTESIYPYFLQIVLIYIVIRDYKGKKIKGIIRFFVTYYIIAFCSITVSLNGYMLFYPDITVETMEVNKVTDPVMIFVNILNLLFFGIIFFSLYFGLYKRRITVRCGVRELVLASLYPILCIAVTIIIIFGSTGNGTIIVLTGMSILMAMLLPVFLYYTRISQYYQKRSDYQEHHMQAELAYFMQYKQAQEETIRFRHDIRNNLLCISEMLQSGKTEEAQAYLQDLVNTSETLRKKYVSGDEMLDCIIGVKTGDMEEQGIRFQLDGVLAGGLQWKPVDICNVFANALDNAIEACQKLAPEKRKITMNIKATPQFWFVTIENPVTETIDTTKLFQKNGGYTSKPNAVHHGIGTYNMKSTVESYGDILKAECNGETFVLEIMIVKSSPV